MIDGMKGQSRAASPATPAAGQDSLAELARRRLEAEACFRGRLHLIRIEARGGTLFLSGRLPSFYMKQVLQTTLRGIDGVSEIENHVEVD
jgi:hypothetical protein